MAKVRRIANALLKAWTGLAPAGQAKGKDSAAAAEGRQQSPEEVSDRIRQEVTFYALKMDVAEEINRLRTHVAEVRRILKEGGAAGRRLDFVTQEMNREANTLGSKSAAIEMTDAAVALKLCIDQMREQLQNIE